LSDDHRQAAGRGGSLIDPAPPVITMASPFLHHPTGHDLAAPHDGAAAARAEPRLEQDQLFFPVWFPAFARGSFRKPLKPLRFRRVVR